MGVPTTYPAAVDAMFAMFFADWRTYAAAIVGTQTMPEIRWQGVEQPTAPSPASYWARVTEQMVTEAQASLAGGAGQKLYRSQGLIFAQIFAPTTDPAGYTRGRMLAEMARNIFRKREPNDLVWFRDAKIAPVGISNSWHQLNVSAVFQFDEMS